MKTEIKGMIKLRALQLASPFLCIGAVLLIALPLIVAWCVIGGRLK